MDKDAVLQNAAADAINKLSAFLSESKDFVVDQAPELANQILAFAIAQDILIIAISIVIVVISYMATFKWSDQNLDYFDSWQAAKLSAASFGGIASVISTVFAILALFDAIKVVFAPKLYLLQYILHFTKG